MTTDKTEATRSTSTNSKTVVLDSPINLPGGHVIDRVTVRKPTAGALRGLALSDLLRLQTDAIQTIVPRVTEPMIPKHEVGNIDPADLVALGTAVSSFLIPKAERADFQSE